MPFIGVAVCSEGHRALSITTLFTHFSLSECHLIAEQFRDTMGSAFLNPSAELMHAA